MFRAWVLLLGLGQGLPGVAPGGPFFVGGVMEALVDVIVGLLVFVCGYLVRCAVEVL